MKNTFYFVVLISLLFFSCEQKTKDSNENKVKVGIDSTSQELPVSQQLVFEIENNISNLHEVRSLNWEKTIDDNSEFREVHAYMNDEGIPSKLVEYFSMGNFKEQGERHYYFKGGQVLAVVSKKDVWIDSNTVLYKETETFYDEKKPVLSRTRTSEYIDEIDQSEWEKIRPISYEKELKTVNNILTGQGVFRTHFISVIKGQNELFLLLGESKDDNRYVTTVLADQNAPFVRDLLNNLKEYKFRPIDIQFNIIGGENGQPEFRLMTSAEWAD
jgi:hypothetical protein